MNMLDLLLEAPEDQITRTQITYHAVAAGRWEDAAFSLRNAVSETSPGDWSRSAEEIADYCEQQVNTVN